MSCALAIVGAVTLALGVQLPGPAQAGITPGERAAIDAGRQAVREERVRTSAWPRVTIFQLVDATPREAAAIFTDYARHSTYLPGLKKSAIARRLSPRVTEVDYVLEVPIFADEDYTVRDSISLGVTDGSYRVDWVKVRARSTKEIVGSVTFEPYRTGDSARTGTLITYENLVSPGQLLAGPLKGRALKQVRETVSALVKQIGDERANQPDLLATQVAALDSALAGSSHWQNVSNAGAVKLPESIADPANTRGARFRRSVVWIEPR
jgi:hypothetical protein